MAQTCNVPQCINILRFEEDGGFTDETGHIIINQSNDCQRLTSKQTRTEVVIKHNYVWLWVVFIIVVLVIIFIVVVGYRRIT